MIYDASVFRKRYNFFHHIREKERKREREGEKA